jgi:hypothetical protein
MLKLHHLNLLNEIHETALMLNLFEQRQLIREQQAKMRQIQRLPLNDSRVSERCRIQVNHQRGMAKISDDELDIFDCGSEGENLPSRKKRSAVDIDVPNKRQK